MADDSTVVDERIQPTLTASGDWTIYWYDEDTLLTTGGSYSPEGLGIDAYPYIITQVDDHGCVSLPDTIYLIIKEV